MKRTLIRDASIVNGGEQYKGSVIIEDEIIKAILLPGQEPPMMYTEVIDATGQYLLPGVIDEHVHFRDPGLTYKGDILSESQAAAAGGVTSIMDMPNTNPLTTCMASLAGKFELMAEKSSVNYSCYFGATNNNYKLFGQLDRHKVCGIKLFMGSSTGNMLVDRMNSLQNIFNGTDLLIAAHCESQDIIKANTEKYLSEGGIDNDLPLEYHPLIRSVQACYESSKLAVQLAQAAGARLHIMHISTKKELDLLNGLPLSKKKITAEACVPHLIFTSDDYKVYGSRIKCNPAVKEPINRDALRIAINAGVIDTIGTDHAPHLLREKEGGALKATSGMPMIQFSLVSMLNLVKQKVFTLEKVVEKMCHAPASLYGIHNRGYIREGYQADLVLVCPEQWTLRTEDILSTCGWSPLEGKTFAWKVKKTFVNGHKVYADGEIDTNYRGQQLSFR